MDYPVIILVCFLNVIRCWGQSLVTLCDKCGDCGENNSAHDFKLIAAAAWTEEETLLLLESVLKHGDDWELITQSVSTKSRLDCISKLIELPFGEFLMGSSSGRLRSSIPTSEDENLSSPSNPLEQMKADGLEQKETETREEKGDDHVVDEDEPPAKRKRVAMLSDGGDSSLMKQVNKHFIIIFPHMIVKLELLNCSKECCQTLVESNFQEITYCATGRSNGMQSWSICHNSCCKSCNRCSL